MSDNYNLSCYCFEFYLGHNFENFVYNPSRVSQEQNTYAEKNEVYDGWMASKRKFRQKSSYHTISWARGYDIHTYTYLFIATLSY